MRGWIPPLPLACGLASFGLSWIVLFAIARSGALGPSPLVLGWIHLVALGWISTVALAVLLHAVPGFLDVEWDGAGPAIARACTPVFAIASLALAAGFICGTVWLLEAAGTVLFASVLVYIAAIARPLISAMRGERVARAVARAFAGTFVLLILTATLGVAFAFALGGRLPAGLLAGTPGAHALLGIGGWLTLLVTGVSARTMGPIAGTRSRFPLLHIGCSCALLIGTLAAALGAALRHPAIEFAGAGLLVLGAVLYAADIFDVLARATVPHRPPQTLMGCAAVWSVVAAALLLASSVGAPLAAAAVYVALMGWIGSAVLAHIHHIGVRVLITTARGEEDETRPGSVLDGRLTWTATGLFQLAVLAGGIAVAWGSAGVLELAALAGFVAFAVLVANLRHAWTIVSA
jgi:hypothetical protein